MMTKLQSLLKKCIDSRLVTSCVTTLLLSVPQAALAGYAPPPDQRPPSGQTTSSGTRGGCSGSEGLPLTVLAPQKHVGQTASVHPTFAWFVPISIPMEFTLHEYGSDAKLKVVHKISLQSSPGIMKLSLPEDKPGLVRGKRYLWQVAILCDRNHPSKDLVANAEIEVVETPPALKRQLSTTMDRLEIANLYARAGLWYEALREALGSAEDSRLGEAASSLLEDLAKLEEPEGTQVKSTHSGDLRQIAAKGREMGRLKDRGIGGNDRRVGN